MSQSMNKREIEFREKVGSRRTVSITLTDSTNTALDMTSTTTYNTGKWKVWKPDGTLLINGNITFLTRASGIVSYDLSATDTAAANAGVWEGEVEIFNDEGILREQSETFTFIIEESY